MSATMASTAAVPWTRAITDRRFLRHYLEMVLAMAVGMGALAPLWHVLVPGGSDSATVMTVSMSVDMVAGMSAWMAWRRHGVTVIVEMAIAMLSPFGLLLVLFWVDLVGVGTVMLAGHLLMLVTMLLAMLYRREAYLAGPHR